MTESSYITVLQAARDRYRGNAQHAIEGHEFRKASELLWGALTQQLKILAATANVVITRHREFFDFLRQLASELRDESIYKKFVDLNALHRNFYDEIIPEDVFPDYYQRAVAFIGRLDELARRRAA